jgi:hypothetical protein
MTETSGVPMLGLKPRSEGAATGGGTKAASMTPGVSSDVAAKRRWAGWLCILLLLAHAVMLAWQGCRDSATWDEVGHLAAGLSHWRNGTFSSYRVNPPLVRLIACAPVVSADLAGDLEQYELIQDPHYRAEFGSGRELVRSNGERYFRQLTIARWACIPFSLLGAWICFLWARELYGIASGVLAVLLWVCCPNILAHGHLITPDVGATALGLMGAYAFWTWLKSPNWPHAATAGLALGLAELTKATWIILFVLWPALWIGYRWSESAHRGTLRWRRELLHLGLMVLLAILLLNVGYLSSEFFACKR